MNAIELKTRLVKCVLAGLPVIIKGAPGVGKSDLVDQVAVETKHRLILTHPVVSDPTDYKGMPAIVNDAAEFLPFGDLRLMLEATKPTIVFIDDMGQAPGMVQAALMQLLLARRINGKKLPDCVTFIAATNRREDRAGVTGMIEPVKSRFATIYQLDVDTDAWVEWAMGHDVPAEVIGFVHFRPALLHKFIPTSDITNSPCPRTWANVGKLMKAGLDDVETFAGAVGEGAATEFIGFLRICNSLPDLDDVIDKPDKAPVPKDPATLYAIVSGLVEKVSKKNIENIIRYANRLPADFSVLMIRDCIRKDGSVQNTKGFVTWARMHKDILM